MELTKTHDIVEMFVNGKIGVFPTDTAFGIGCRMDDSHAVSDVFEIRHRVETKPLLVLVSSIQMAENYVQISDEVKEKLLNRFWPGGLTIVLPCLTEKVPSNVRAGGETLAVRMPAHEHLREIIEKVGVPIVAPSANFAGEQTPYKLSEVDPELIRLVDFVMVGECRLNKQSTVINCAISPWKIERQGAVKVSIQ